MAIIQTPRLKLRAPDDTELVRDGAKNLRDLASDLDGVIPRLWATSVSTTVVDAFGVVNITIPSGTFTAQPVVTATDGDNSHPFYSAHVYYANTNAGQVSLQLLDKAGVFVPQGTAVRVNIVAVQP